MVFFAAFMLWSFSSTDYRAMRGERPHTNSFTAFFHSQNYWDFIKDTGLALKFFFDYALRRPHTRSAAQDQFDTAFGVNRNGDFSNASLLNEMDTYPDRTQVWTGNSPNLSPKLQWKQRLRLMTWSLTNSFLYVYCIDSSSNVSIIGILLRAAKPEYRKIPIGHVGPRFF